VTKLYFGKHLEIHKIHLVTYCCAARTKTVHRVRHTSALDSVLTYDRLNAPS